MAISLTSDGLHLNYPSRSISYSSSGNYPVGCAVVMNNSTESDQRLSGTWAKITVNYVSSQNSYRIECAPDVGATIYGNMKVYALAIRVA